MFKKIFCGALVVVSVFGIATLCFTSAAFEYLSLSGLTGHSVSRQSEHCVASFQGNSGLVVVFCGGSGQRALYGAELVKKGYGKELVLCGTIPELSFVSGLIEEHYPDAEISGKILKVVVPDTKETVKYVVSRLDRDRSLKVIGVTSSWHLRRSIALLEHYANGDDSRCLFVGTGKPLNYGQVWLEFGKYWITLLLIKLGLLC